MSNVPEGATLSEDGYYWWDGSQWQPVQHDGDAGPGGDGGGGNGQQPGQPIIGFVDVYAGDANTGMGPRVIIDTEDNPDNHHVLHIGAGCVAVWGEGNGGTAEGPYADTWAIDGGSDQTLDNLTLAPQITTTRSVSLGRLTAGKHTFTLTLNGVAYGEDRDFDVSDI
jgi:hypothetical protein